MGSVAKVKIESSSRWSVVAQVVEIMFVPEENTLVRCQSSKIKRHEPENRITNDSEKEIVNKVSHVAERGDRVSNQDVTEGQGSFQPHWQEKWWINVFIVTCLIGMFIAGAQSFFADSNRLQLRSN